MVPGPPGSRWKVILVRPGPASTLSPVSGSSMLPTLLLDTEVEEEAQAFAARFRAEGANVVVMQEGAVASATCPDHPPQFLGRTCTGCGRDICAVCRLEAGNHRLCGPCAAAQRARARARRTRQLFVLFLFTVFCYLAIGYWREERRRLDPSTTISVAVFQFGSAEALASPLVRRLNDPASEFAIGQVGPWYARERERLTAQAMTPVRVSTFGPWTVGVQPPRLADEDDPAWKQALLSFQYPRYFHGLARDQGADPDRWDVRVYVVYGTGSSDLAAHSRGSSRGRVAVAFVDAEEKNPAYAQLTVAHELAHVLGAEDLYDPVTFRAVIPRGLAEPGLEPRYPQDFAEVMALDRATSPTTEEEVWSLDQVVIGYHTATLIGWMSEEQSSLLYGVGG